MVGAAVLLSTASSGGGSPLTSLGVIGSILGSIATIITVAIMTREARGKQKAREGQQRTGYQKLLDDFYGDHRQGVPFRPGVLEWMETINTQMDKVLSEITPNHGGSMKDAVSRVEADVKSLHDRLDKQGS